MYFLRRLLVLFITLTIAFVYIGNSAPIPSSSTVVFDTSTGFFGIDSESSVGLSILKEELELEGFVVTDNVLMNIEADEITASLISRSDVLVIVNPNRKFDRDEINLIKHSVYTGKKLLLVSDTPESARYMNYLSWVFGAEFVGSYFLGDDLKIPSQSIGEIHLISPIHLELKVEPEISLQSGQVDAKAWLSVWERPKETIKKDDFMVFAGVRYGKGSVAFLGDKDVLLNRNIVKGDNLQFVQTLFDWLVYGRPIGTVKYFPEQLEFVDRNGNVSVYKLMIKNTGDVNQSLKFKLPAFLNETFSIDEGVLEISQGTIAVVELKIVGTGDSTSVTDFIIVERAYGLHQDEDYIPIRVLWQN